MNKNEWKQSNHNWHIPILSSPKIHVFLSHDSVENSGSAHSGPKNQLKKNSFPSLSYIWTSINLNLYIYINLPRLRFRWVKDGKRITLKHSEKHHFRTKPFLDSFRTRSETSLQNTAVKHDIRFTDRHSTLKGRVPKRCLYQKTTPMRNLLLTSCIPL